MALGRSTIDAPRQQGRPRSESAHRAILAAANYLCSGARNLATPSGWWRAILSYNDVRNYATAVFDAATEYGTKSRVA